MAVFKSFAKSLLVGTFLVFLSLAGVNCSSGNGDNVANREFFLNLDLQMGPDIGNEEPDQDPNRDPHAFVLNAKTSSTQSDNTNICKVVYQIQVRSNGKVIFSENVPGEIDCVEVEEGGPVVGRVYPIYRNKPIGFFDTCSSLMTISVRVVSGEQDFGFQSTLDPFTANFSFEVECDQPKDLLVLAGEDLLDEQGNNLAFLCGQGRPEAILAILVGTEENPGIIRDICGENPFIDQPPPLCGNGQLDGEEECDVAAFPHTANNDCQFSYSCMPDCTCRFTYCALAFFQIDQSQPALDLYVKQALECPVCGDYNLQPENNEECDEETSNEPEPTCGEGTTCRYAFSDKECTCGKACPNYGSCADAQASVRSIPPFIPLPNDCTLGEDCCSIVLGPGFRCEDSEGLGCCEPLPVECDSGFSCLEAAALIGDCEPGLDCCQLAGQGEEPPVDLTCGGNPFDPQSCCVEAGSSICGDGVWDSPDEECDCTDPAGNGAGCNNDCYNQCIPPGNPGACTCGG